MIPAGQEAVVERSHVQGLPELQSEFKSSSGTLWDHLKIKSRKRTAGVELTASLLPKCAQGCGVNTHTTLVIIILIQLK